MSPLFLDLDRIMRLHRSLIEHYGGIDGTRIGASQITKWQAPLHSPDPPGVDVKLLPKKTP